MFRIVSIIVFLAAFVGIAFHYIVSRPAHRRGGSRPKLGDTERQSCVIGILKKLVHLLTLLFLEQRLSPIAILRKLVYLLALLCFVVLAVTGFFPLLVLGKSISGYWLMVHATAAPVFAGCLAILAVMWADSCRFNEYDWPWLQRIIRREAVSKEPVSERHEPAQRICFWLIVLLALPVILSIVLSMFPLFGTEGQEFLLNTHRYSALLLAVVAIVHTYLIIRTQIER